MTESLGVEYGGSAAPGGTFDWDSVSPEPDESHGLPDWYPRIGSEPSEVPALPEPPPRPWWSRSVSLNSMWCALGLIVVVALGLAKLVSFWVVAHIHLAGAHA